MLTLPKTGKRTPAVLSTFVNVSVPGTRAGAIVSLGLVIIAWIAIPVMVIHSWDLRTWFGCWVVSHVVA